MGWVSKWAGLATVSCFFKADYSLCIVVLEQGRKEGGGNLVEV